MTSPLDTLQSSGVIFTPVHPITLKSAIERLQQGEPIKSFPYGGVSLPEKEVAHRKALHGIVDLFVNRITRRCGMTWQFNEISQPLFCKLGRIP